MKAWHAANPRDRRAYKAVYDAANADRQRQYRLANVQKHKAQMADWYKANRDSALAKVKAYAAANHERVLAYHAKYYATHPEKVKAWSKAWKAANPERKQYLENRRRARKAGNGGSHTLAERRERFARLGNVCYYCGEAKTLTVDHAVPLSRGGTDDIANVLPACRSCNSRKNKQTAAEYFGRTNHQRIGGVEQGR